MPTWALWLACGGFMILRALIAAAESALYAISDMRAKELAVARAGAGRRVLKHKLEREPTAAAIRIGMVICGFLAAGIGAIAPPQMLDVRRFGEDLPSLLTPLAGVILVAVIASVLDVTARAVAVTDPEITALRLSRLVSVLVVLFYPPMKVVVALLDLVVRPFGGRIRFESPPPPLEELEKLLEAQAAANEVDRGAPQLIRSIFEMTDKRCRDVMVPRTDVVSIELATPPTEILRILAEEGHSRLPVFKDDPDHIVGVLHTRDLIPLLEHPELIVLHDIIRPATFVPWVKPIGDLLREMQAARIHMAVVVDEHGGFMGIVTLEDILREIVGDISDEFSEDDRTIEKLPDGTWLVDASMEIGEVTQSLGVAVPEGEYETLGGFLSSLAGALPEAGDRFSHNGWQFVVHSKDGARLDRIRVSRPKVGGTQVPGAGSPGRAG